MDDGDLGWTCGEQQNIQDWCDMELRPNEAQGDDPLPRHYEVLHAFLTAKSPAPASEVAAAYLSLADDTRPLSVIFEQGSTTDDPIQQAIQELPPAHPRLAGLLRAIRDIPADKVDMTADQRAELADEKLNESFRLTLLRFYIWDGLGGEPHEELNFAAFQACFSALDKNTEELKDGLRTIRDGLEREAGYDDDLLNNKVQQAAYWLIRAGRLIYANFDAEDGTTSWVGENYLGEPSELWKPAKDTDKARLTPERWQFWKQRLEHFVMSGQALYEDTVDAAEDAPHRMYAIQSDCRPGVHGG